MIYSSPLQRAIDTAKIIAKYNGNMNIRINKDLIEIDYGKKYIIIPLKFQNKKAFLKVSERMNKSIKKIANENNGKTVCIVSHGIAIQSYMCRLYNKEARKIQQLKNTEYIEFEL